MVKKILAALGLGVATSASAQPTLLHSPFNNGEANFIYNLLFCDDLQLFRSGNNKNPEGFWLTLLAPKPDAAELRAIAEDESQESRSRVLAYNRLRELKQSVPPKKLLGVILEVGLEGGLDVLAAFPDGRIRYINQSGKMSIFEESPPEVVALLKRLMVAAQPVVERIGPWDGKRLPAPPAGMVRLTFLVSDGLYFGQGPYAQLRSDPMAGPVLAAGEQLLVTVVEKTSEKEDPNNGLEPTR